MTYNYSRWYYRKDTFGDKGIRTIYGMSGADSIPVLEGVINALEECTEELSEEDIKGHERQGATGYWMPTRENAIKPLRQLLAMAKLRPDAE